MAFLFLSACANEDAIQAGDEVLTGRAGDVPMVSGNTFDYWNRLDKVSPDAAIINISYRYAYDHSITFEVPEQFSAQSWVFMERDRDIPGNIVVVTVKKDAVGTEDPVGRTLVFGRHQFISDRFCLSRGDEAPDATIQPYAQDIWRALPEIAGPLFLHRYTSSRPEVDGNRVEIVHISDVHESGHGCSELGDLTSPEGEAAELIDQVRKIAERSFEVIG